jgi:hypothetical protein
VSALSSRNARRWVAAEDESRVTYEDKRGFARRQRARGRCTRRHGGCASWPPVAAGAVHRRHPRPTWPIGFPSVRVDPEHVALTVPGAPVPAGRCVTGLGAVADTAGAFADDLATWVNRSLERCVRESRHGRGGATGGGLRGRDR